MDSNNKQFYENIDRSAVYTVETDPEQHPFYPILIPFIERWHLQHDKKCLEIGSSKGLFQNLVNDYTGVDIAESLRHHYTKNFVVAADETLPFPDNHFDAIFTYATHEHIPQLESSLEELFRVVLKPGGVALFAPAWHTRSWFADGYAVRSYSDLTLGQKLMKFSIPFRDFFIVRYSFVFSRRLIHLLRHWLNACKPRPLMHRKLEANYEVFWQSDSDACNSMDPFDIILWCKERGIQTMGYESLLKSFFVRAYGLQLLKP